MKIKRTLKYMLHLFCVITTAQVVFISVLLAVLGLTATIDYRTLHSIIVTAFVGVLPTIIFIIGTENVSRRTYIFLVAIHFILTTSFVFVSLYYFGMYNQESTIPTIIFFLVIYVTAHITAEIRSKKTIDELNKRINATHKL